MWKAGNQNQHVSVGSLFEKRRMRSMECVALFPGLGQRTVFYLAAGYSS